MFQFSYPTVPIARLAEEYDFIIVGGGTAACVLANRLSQEESVSVLVIERGAVGDGWLSSVPLLSSHFASDGSRSRVWNTVPQKHVNSRVFQLAGGNSLGGGSRINAMLYMRGVPAEYDAWSKAGCKGWSYDEMLPYFVRSETDIDQDRDRPASHHGISGEWQNMSYKQPVWEHTKALIRAAGSMGLPYHVDDPNSPLSPSHGCVKLHFSIDSQGRRSSTSSAFLPLQLIRRRSNHLHICVRALVSRIDVQRDAEGELRAEGVFIQSLDRRASTRHIRAKREVILSAGPISSPQILLLSGIGPAEHLREHGIPVLKDLPGVGSHLQDHLGIAPQYCIPLHDSFLKLKFQPWLILKELLLYLLFGIGLLLSPTFEIVIFLQSRLFDEKYHSALSCDADSDASLSRNIADIEIMPVSVRDMTTTVSVRGPAQRYWLGGGSGNLFSQFIAPGGLGLLSVNLRPTSLGTVRLASSNPEDDPIVDPNYLSTERDFSIMRQAVRFSIQLKEQMATQGYPITDFKLPASDSDADVDAFIRGACETTYHFSSTCRMALEEEGGVVDDRLRVHGVRGLRVADSSIFPQILATHLAAPTVAVAEKCADMVKADN
ncbi:GMC oxidoreductase [Rhodofomes roseus]|uniref:GMC oxidoreductase n=1 Tax=Rhodofomes roseus TaxID=34475 RepID=A0ABQ8KXE9_9APHY|nr:GMC oxidoreductase [Rhodofomes roseus]KAH9843565.1 GMC oxidoreductase [Rhodofomes roseus]